MKRVKFFAGLLINMSVLTEVVETLNDHQRDLIKQYLKNQRNLFVGKKQPWFGENVATVVFEILDYPTGVIREDLIRNLDLSKNSIDYSIGYLEEHHLLRKDWKKEGRCTYFIYKPTRELREYATKLVWLAELSSGI